MKAFISIENSNEKKKKLLELPQEVIRTLAIQAAMEGKSVKAFMESVLVSKAKELEEAALYTYLSKTRPEGHIRLTEQEKNEFESKYGL